MISVLWRRQRVAPPKVPTDTVIPLHSFDDSPILRAVILHFMMRFDDVLDPEALRTSLERLLTLEGWCKLGARIRENDQGKLEYHIPAVFDDERRAVAYHHEAFDISIQEHQLASKLPAGAAGDVPQFLGKPEDFIDLSRKEGDPATLDDYLYTDRPLLGLHIVSFTDATLVTLSWSHVVLDGMGRKALFDAWSLVLHGREEEVLPFHGFADDPLETLGTSPREEYKDADKQMGAWQLLMLGVRHMCFNLWSPPSQDETHMVMIPARFAQDLRATALADISGDEDQNQNDNSSKPFVSEGDVICAWWTRLVVAAQLPATSNRTVSMGVVFGIRWALGKDLLPSDKAYVPNAAIMVQAFASAKDILAKPFGQVAALVRSALQTRGTRDQVEAYAALGRAAKAKGSPLLFGDASMNLVVCTNWSKGNFFHVNFSGAVLKEGTHLGGQAAGRPSYIHAVTFSKGFSMSNAFSILGKDAQGNIWLNGCLRRHYWPSVRAALAKGVV